MVRGEKENYLCGSIMLDCLVELIAVIFLPITILILVVIAIYNDEF